MELRAWVKGQPSWAEGTRNRHHKTAHTLLQGCGMPPSHRNVLMPLLQGCGDASLLQGCGEPRHSGGAFSAASCTVVTAGMLTRLSACQCYPTGQEHLGHRTPCGGTSWPTTAPRQGWGCFFYAACDCRTLKFSGELISMFPSRQYPQVACRKLERLSPRELSRQVLRLQKHYGLDPGE